MAHSFSAYKAGYRRLWDSMVVSPSKIATIDGVAKKRLAAKARYQGIEKATGVPWWAVAVIHQMECGGDFRLSIAQGDPWNKVSVRVPRGRGPFNSWEEDCIVFFREKGLDKIKDFGIERLCYMLEGYNGWGYRGKGVNSAYLWSYSNQYTSGKYIADHVWDSSAVSKQVGAMPLLKRMMVLDPSIKLEKTKTQAPLPPPPDIEPVEPEAKQPKPMVKSKTIWASVAAALTTAGSAFVDALGDWRVWAALIVLCLLLYIAWERNGKPDIKGWFKSS